MDLRFWIYDFGFTILDFISIVNRKSKIVNRKSIPLNYSDFKKLDNGVVLPHITDMDLGQFQLTTTVKKVEINAAIAEKIFDKK